MPVFLAMRRGNWLFSGVCQLFGTNMRAHPWLRAVVKWFVSDSWSSSSLVLTTTCTNGCTFCKRTRSHFRSAGHVVHFHLDKSGDHAGDALVVDIDADFGDRDAWLFLQLDAATCTKESLLTFMDQHKRVRINHAGIWRNFIGIPSWRDWLPEGCVRPALTHGWAFRSPIGAATSASMDEEAEYFCSELVGTYMQQHGYKLDQVPARLTPQLLLASVANNSEMFDVNQYVIGEHANESTIYHNFFTPFRITPVE